MYNIKFAHAQQAQGVYTFKHIEVNLMMTNAAIWLNKINKRIEVNREIN
jgi:hypothetical protein